MTQKERWVDLYVNYYLEEDENKQFWLEDNRVNEYLKPAAEKIADYFLQNGVIVPPCKVGDTVFRLVIDCADASENDCDGHCWSCKYLIANITDETVIDHNHQIAVMNLYGLHYFSTRAEAEQALKERETK